jgi:hypothetical protein
VPRNKGLRLYSLVATGLAITAPIRAQIGTATITGRVTDPAGAAVPNVAVSVVQTETNFSFPATTNADGLFRVQSLQPGTYRLTFDANGFKRIVREGVSLRTGETLEVNIGLEVGQVNESVTVTTAMPLLETENSSQGTVVEGTTLYNLPLYQRYLGATSYLTSNVVMATPNSGETLSQIHIEGQRSTSIGVFMDGTSGNDPMTGTTILRPIQGAVEEVNVLTSVLPAEYGHGSGGAIVSVSKTGTNSFHGMASVFGRSRSMQEKNYFDAYRNSQPEPGAPNGLPIMFLQPDANGGGPLVIPKLYNGRNKTFWFVAYQKLIDKEDKDFVGQTPTPQMLGGDFTMGGVGAPIYDPLSTTQLANGTWTRTPVPGNVIPPSRFDQVAARIIGYDPWNAPSLGFGSEASTGPVSNLNYIQVGQAYYEDYQGRIDHQFTDNIKLFGSYLYNHEAGPGWETDLHNKTFDGTNGNETPLTVQNYTIGSTWIISPSLVNDLRFGYERYRNDKIVPSYDQNWPQKLGIPNDNESLFPEFGISSNGQFSPETLYGLDVTGPSTQIGETISFRDDLTKMHGAHAFKMGFEALHFRENSSVVDVPSGDYVFDNTTAGLQPNGQPVPNTGNPFAGFEFGAVSEALFDEQITNWLPRNSIMSVYVQDDWRVSPSLTLNLGLRYSNESPYHVKYANGQSNFDPNVVDPLTGLMGALVNPTGNLNKRDNLDFQPRIGLAWHPLSKWVFRGGFAINTVDIKFPIARGQFDNEVAQAVQEQPPGNPLPIFYLSQGPLQPLSFDIGSNGTATYVGTNYSARNVNWWNPDRNPYVLNWNTTLEYSVSTNYLISLTYTGSAGESLLEDWNINAMPVNFGSGNPALQNAAFAAPQNYRPYPQFGTIDELSNFGHSTYHAGTVKVQKRSSRGLVFTASYTFSKAIDEQDSNTTGDGVAPVQDRSLDKGRAGYDRNHVFVASATYDLPFGRGKALLNRGGAWNYAVGGYQIAWIQTFQSGLPMTFTFANSPYNYFPTYAGDQWPNVVPGCNANMYPNWKSLMASSTNRLSEAAINPVLNVNCFSYPPAFTPGDAGRNIVSGPGLICSTISVKKDLAVRERYRVQVRLDMNNPFKNWAFSNPTTSFSLVNPQLFGKITSVPQTSPGEFGGAPLMNLSLKFFW